MGGKQVEGARMHLCHLVHLSTSSSGDEVNIAGVVALLGHCMLTLVELEREWAGNHLLL